MRSEVSKSVFVPLLQVRDAVCDYRERFAYI